MLRSSLAPRALGSLAVFTAATLMTANTQAGVIVSEVAFPVTDPNLALQVDTSSAFADAFGKSGGGNETQFAQTFQVSSTITLDKIVIEVDDQVDGASFDIKLYQVSDVNSSSLSIDGGDLLSGLSYTIPGTSSNGQTALQFDFDGADEVVLSNLGGTAGYAFAIETNSALTSAGVLDWVRGSDQYSDGAAYGSSGKFSFSGGSGRDFTLAVIAVPEPGSLALIGLGGVLCLRRRRA